MIIIYWSIIFLMILLTFLLICCYFLLGVNERVTAENAELKKKLDIIRNELDSILERYASVERKPPPES